MLSIMQNASEYGFDELPDPTPLGLAARRALLSMDLKNYQNHRP